MLESEKDVEFFARYIAEKIPEDWVPVRNRGVYQK